MDTSHEPLFRNEWYAPLLPNSTDPNVGYLCVFGRHRHIDYGTRCASHCTTEHGMVSRCRRAFEGTQLNRSQFYQTFDSPNRQSCIQRSYLLLSTTDTQKEISFIFFIFFFSVACTYVLATSIRSDAVSPSYFIVLLLDWVAYEWIDGRKNRRRKKQMHAHLRFSVAFLVLHIFYCFSCVLVCVCACVRGVRLCIG